jgi:hypothetical protein
VGGGAVAQIKSPLSRNMLRVNKNEELYITLKVKKNEEVVVHV